MAVFQPEPGDFEVVPMGGQGGKLIQIAQIISNTGRSNYEHARLYLGDGLIVEAQPGGARIVPMSINDGGLWSTGIIALSDEERSKIIAAGYEIGQAHTGYSAADYFALAAYKYKVGLLVPGLKWYVGWSGRLICSQLVDKCYQAAGVQLFNDKRWNGYVTPGDLADLLISPNPVLS